MKQSEEKRVSQKRESNYLMNLPKKKKNEERRGGGEEWVVGRGWGGVRGMVVEEGREGEEQNESVGERGDRRGGVGGRRGVRGGGR